MPPARRPRQASTQASRAAQSTLSFGSRNKVTKPSAAPSTAEKKASTLTAALHKPTIATVINTEEDDEDFAVAKDTGKVSGTGLGHVTSEAAVAQQAAIVMVKPKTEAEISAEKVGDAAIKRYWKAKEAERKAGRGRLSLFVPCLAVIDLEIVHQENLSIEEKILRLFDVSSQYGVSVCIRALPQQCRISICARLTFSSHVSASRA